MPPLDVLSALNVGACMHMLPLDVHAPTPLHTSRCACTRAGVRIRKAPPDPSYLRTSLGKGLRQVAGNLAAANVSALIRQG